MDAEVADLLLALEKSPHVDSVRALKKPRPGWPWLFVVMRDDSAYALGSVTGLVVRALPHRDRSHVGVAGEARLRELWLPMSGPIRLSEAEHAAAVARAEERRRREPAVLPHTASIEPAEPEPLSVPVIGPFEANRVWSLRGERVVVVEVVPDPFRSPAAVVLVVTGDDALAARIERTAPARARVLRAVNVETAMRCIALERPRRIVCGESHALGDGGLVERVEREQPDLLEALEIACAEASAEWVSSYLAARKLARVRVVTESGEERSDAPDEDDELLDVWLERDT